MSDGVAITAGAGTTVATDDCGASGHAQIVKLAYSSDGAATLVTVDADGVLVNLGANNDVTVAGVSTAAKQDTGNTSLATIAGTVAGTEVQVDVLTSALPTGASTAAKQPALGTAGTASTDVITVQGIAAMTALKVDGSAVTQPVSGTFWQATQPVSGTVTANLAAGTNNIGDVDVLSLPALVAGTANIGDVDVLTVPAPLSTTGTGTEATALRVTIATDSTGLVSVDDNGGALTVDNGGTFVTQVNGDALTALQLIDNTILVDDVAFTPATHSVSMAGVQAVAHGADPDVGDAGDAVALIANRHRILFNLGGHPNLVSAEYYTTGAGTDDPVIAVVSAGTKIVVTGISAMCSAANTVNVAVRIGFGTASVPAQGSTGADGVAKVILSHPGIAPGSGVMKGHAGGIVGIGADGEDLRITNGAPTTGSLIIQVDYFLIAS